MHHVSAVIVRDIFDIYNHALVEYPDNVENLADCLKLKCGKGLSFKVCL